MKLSWISKVLVIRLEFVWCVLLIVDVFLFRMSVCSRSFNPVEGCDDHCANDVEEELGPTQDAAAMRPH